MIDVALQLAVASGRRRFALDARLATKARCAALYGPSGSGKSLTLQGMAGLLKPVRGHVRIGGRTLYDSARGIDLPPAARRLGYLFQHYALFPHLSVRRNVAFGLTRWWRGRLAAADALRVDALIERFGLREMAAARPRELSGGQQQRVALARAMACEPWALLLDEPFAALNPLLRQSLRADLRRVMDESGIPVLMVTHDADDVLALADAAFVYEEGHVRREVDLAAGTARDVALAAIGAPPAPPDTPWRRDRLALLDVPAAGTLAGDAGGGVEAAGPRAGVDEAREPVSPPPPSRSTP